MVRLLISGTVAAVLVPSAGAQVLWDTGAFDGLNGRISDVSTPASRPQTRAADDFVLAAGNGQPYALSALHGRALGIHYSTAFAEIYADAGGQPATAPLATLPQLTLQVTQTGVFQVYDLLDLTFDTTGVSLSPGRYWVSVVCNVSGDPPPGDGYGYFATAGSGTVQGLPGMYRVATGPWTPITSAGIDPTDFSFRVEGQQGRPPCYANCDNSTTPPILNIADFVCYQSLFAAGSSLANCDGSTTPPILNIADFVCFQAAFAAGCQ
jgi:hypothetical protein